MADQNTFTKQAKETEGSQSVVGQNVGRTASDRRIKFMVTAAIMTAVLCVLGPLSLPIGPVPISLTNLVIYLMLYILDWKRGTAAYLLYLLIGLVGLPVFSGFTGGAAKLVGPTGGYLIGFIPMTILIGLFVDRFAQKRILCIIVMEAATWIAYLLGTAWLAVSAHMTFAAALAAGVIPFIAEDLAKMILAALLGPVLRKRLERFRHH